MGKVKVYLDMDGTLYKWPLVKSVYNPPEMYGKGFFENLEPMEGAIPFVIKLLQDERVDVWILTQPIADHAPSYADKVRSVMKHFPQLKDKIIMVQDKSLLDKGILIDDNEKWNQGKHRFIWFFKWGSTVERFLNCYIKQEVANGNSI